MGDHPLFAAMYDRILAASEEAGLAARRGRLLSGARGRVLEIGGGTGLNLPHYPPGQVSSVVILEPDGAMRRRLVARAEAAPVPVEVRSAGVDDLVPTDGPFDTVVCTLVLCTVPDLRSAVAAIEGVLAPGGDLLFLEHVAVPGLRGRLQHAVTPIWKHLAGGCHIDRDPVLALADSGLAVVDLERFDVPGFSRIDRAGVQGRARLRVGAATAGDPPPGGGR